MKILIASHDQMLTEGLECLIDGFGDEYSVVGCASDGAEALTMIGATNPDLVIATLLLEQLNGVDLTHHVVETSAARVIILTTDPGKEPLAEAFQMGASGCIASDSDADELKTALNTVSEGNKYLCASSHDILIERVVNDNGDDDPVYAELTTREREVMKHLAEGLNSKEVGDKLHISPKTVDTHRRNIMKKLDIDNVAALVKHAIRSGLTEIED